MTAVDTAVTEVLQTEIETETKLSYFCYNSQKENYMQIFQNKSFIIEKEPSQIPWIKIFTKEPYKELSDMPKQLRLELWNIYDIVEKEMREYYKPDKINMASFGNMLPRVHIHVMARFKNDSYFPNPMWGEKLRDANLDLPDEEEFYKRVIEALKQLSLG